MWWHPTKFYNSGGGTKVGKRSLGGFSLVISFLALYVFWILNSGKIEAFYLILGVVCSLAIAYIFHEIFVPIKDPKMAFTTAIRFLLYIPWLFYQIVLANLDVAKRVLHPAMPIQPHIISFPSKLKSDLSMTTLGNSITLTPGTITVDIDPDGTFYVHCIAKEPAEALLSEVPCEMAARVGYVFGELEGKKR
jgi:multicomponent Na+:H+ antiporter subunit E